MNSVLVSISHRQHAKGYLIPWSNPMEPTDKEYIQQAKNYREAMGGDPNTIKTIEDAERLFGYIQRECARWGSD